MMKFFKLNVPIVISVGLLLLSGEIYSAERVALPEYVGKLWRLIDAGRLSEKRMKHYLRKLTKNMDTSDWVERAIREKKIERINIVLVGIAKDAAR